MTLTFDIADGATGSSGINLTSSSNAAGFTFDGQSHDIVITAESDDSGSEPMSSQLSINSVTGAITLAGEADYQTVPNYMFTVTASNGADSAYKDIILPVANYASYGDQNVTGTNESDVIAVSGHGNIVSGDGEDTIVIHSAYNFGAADTPVISDFESGVDSIDASVALMALGYTGISSSLDGGAQENKLSVLTDVSDDILDLVSNNDASLNNAFGSYFDDASNVLTLFVDTDASQESHLIEKFEIAVGDDSIVDDDDLAVALDAFIA